MIAEVIVDINNSEVDKIFDYICFDDALIGSRVVVPFGNKVLNGIIINLKNTSEFDKNKLKNILNVFDEPPVLTSETLELALLMKKKYHISMALILRLFLPNEMRQGKVKESLKSVVSINEEKSVIEMVSSLAKNSKTQKNILGFLNDIKKIDKREIVLKFGISSLNKLIEKDFVREEKIKVYRTPYEELVSNKGEIVLTNFQKLASDTISNSNNETFLLHGVTGSGKTEVYLSAIEKILNEGKTAIMLVPESALTPQMLSQLRNRFKNMAALLHSGMSAGEKFDEWWRLRNGEAKVAIGARSAIFAPLSNLGIIIIDEEHDGSYLSESSPRYDTLEVAKFRKSFSKCNLVLGSATPSISSYSKAISGEIKLLELTERINKKPMPTIKTVDMRKEIKAGNASPFSRELIEELEKCLANKEQVILFLNRRGFSPNIICQECGYVAKCESCDVSLTYHSDENILKCHYCNAKYNMLSSCPKCESKFIRYSGFGTQRIEEKIKKLFKDAKILRMDNDTTQNKESHLNIITAFSEKKADILIGTQMIAKGHDFPFVTLVGIIDADMSLHFSDFRSSERTFQLITQVSGRSGRSDKSGVVVLQTFTPEHNIFNFATSYDYKGFFEYENSLRKSTLFPPYSKIARIMFLSEDENEVIEAVRLCYLEIKKLVECHKDAFVFFNKMKSPIKRIQKKFRFQILMRVKNAHEKVFDDIYEIIERNKIRNVLIYLEINPQNLS